MPDPILIFKLPGADKQCFCCTNRTDLYSIIDRAWVCLECLQIIAAVEHIAENRRANARAAAERN